MRNSPPSAIHLNTSKPKYEKKILQKNALDDYLVKVFKTLSAFITHLYFDLSHKDFLIKHECGHLNVWIQNISLVTI